MQKISKIIDKNAIKILACLSPVLVCRYTYLTRMRKRLSLRNPVNYNEKIQWLKLYNYNNNSLVVKCADKYNVSSYVEECGCKEILNEIYKVYEQTSDINFDELPEKFVLKTTHGCGGNIICTSKECLNSTEALEKLNASLSTDYGKLSGELFYSKIPPKIICEKYLDDGSGSLPVDYKIYCFNGVPMLVLVISNRDSDIKLDFLTFSWERLDLVQPQFRSETPPEKPKNFDTFIDYATKLSKPFPFVRVDLYNVNNKPVFGELTFTPAAGVATYYSEYGLKYLGDMLKLEK